MKRTKTLKNGNVVRLRDGHIYLNRKLVKNVKGSPDKQLLAFWKIVGKVQRGEAIP